MEPPSRRPGCELYSQDEHQSIEDAVSTAIHALLDAIYSVNCDKMVKYQSIVEERDEEISRLECKLRQNEFELRVLRGQRRGSGVLSTEDAEDGCKDYQVPAELPTSLPPPSGSAARPPSLLCQYGDRRTAGDRPRRPADPRGPSAAAASSLREPRTVATSSASGAKRPALKAVKAEPPGSEGDAFLIKLETCEPSCDSGHRDGTPHLDRPLRSPTQRRRLTDAERNKRYRQQCRSTPEGLRACREKERLRYLKRRVLVAEMSEDARRRKREMWRAAARRHRDRKTSGLLAQCPPAGDDLFDNWTALRDAESPTRDLQRCPVSELGDRPPPGPQRL